MKNVYLIPCGDRAYRSVISEAPPTPAAIYLTEEGEYPVEIWWERHDLNLCRVWGNNICNTPEELIELLDFLGECVHAIEDLWGYHDRYCADPELSDLFDRCYERKMAELRAAAEDLLSDP